MDKQEKEKWFKKEFLVYLKTRWLSEKTDDELCEFIYNQIEKYHRLELPLKDYILNDMVSIVARDFKHDIRHLKLEALSERLHPLLFLTRKKTPEEEKEMIEILNQRNAMMNELSQEIIDIQKKTPENTQREEEVGNIQAFVYCMIQLYYKRINEKKSDEQDD